MVLLILLAPALCFADLSTNLIAFYPFSGNADDESGGGHHGVFMNGAYLSTNRFENPNSAAGFDGVNDYIQTDLLQNGVTAYSISLWVKSTSTNWLVPFVQDRGGDPGSSVGQSLTLGLRGSDSDKTRGHLFFALDADQKFVGAHSAQSINDGRWHHVVGVWDGSSWEAVNPDQFSLYIDGVKVYNLPFSSPYSFYPPLTGDGGTAIGFHSAWANFFSGALDDIRIYDRVLSETEIQELYTPAAPVNRPPVLKPIGNKAALENQSLEFALYAFDPEGHGLVFSTSELPPGAVFDPANRAFSWTPTPQQACSYFEVTFTVTDDNPEPASAFERIAITVGGSVDYVHYPLDGDARDASGHGHDGILLNGAYWTADRFGNPNQAVGFDGVDDYIQTNLVQTGVNAYSISLWMKTTSTNWLVPLVQDRGGDPGSSVGQGLTLGLRGSNEDGTLGHLFFGLDADQKYAGLHSVQSLNDGEWHHVAGVWDGSNGELVNPAQFAIYIDGIRAASVPFSSPYSFYPPLTGSGGTAIGFHSAWNLFFAGAMDDVYIYSRALADEEIHVRYRGSFNRPPVFEPVGTISVLENETVRFTVKASDPDGDGMTYSSGPLPAGAVFDPATRQFSWTPDGSQGGHYTVDFYATDNFMPPATGKLSVAITVGDVTTPCERAEKIIAAVISLRLARNVERSYLADLRKVCPLIEAGKEKMAIRLLTTFIRQVRHDIRRKVIGAAAGNMLIDMAGQLIGEISGRQIVNREEFNTRIKTNAQHRI
jgi:hypothetical protein